MTVWHKRIRRRTYRSDYVPQSARERIWRAQRGVCPLCARLLPLTPWSAAKGDEPTIDHVKPKAAGGPNALGNYLLVHKACNARKAHRAPFACELIWLAVVVARLNAPLRIGGAPDHIAVAAS